MLLVEKVTKMITYINSEQNINTRYEINHYTQWTRPHI